MCPTQKIISQTKNGVLSQCGHSQLFQLVFNNLCFEFYEWELNRFKEYLETLNISYWENQLKASIHHRKIPISVENKYFVILLNRQEVKELRLLLNLEPNEDSYLRSREIAYQYNAN